MALDVQFKVVFYSFIYGMFYVYTYKLLRKIKSKSKVIIIIFESLFCFCHLVLFYYLLYLINKGIITTYIIIFFVLGSIFCKVLYFNDKKI